MLSTPAKVNFLASVIHSTVNNSMNSQVHAPNNASMKEWLLLFCPSSTSIPQPLWNVQCTYTKWVTQSFRPHLPHSYTCHPEERRYIRQKWHTLKYSKRELLSLTCTKSSPKLFPASVRCIFFIPHFIYHSKNSFNYSRENCYVPLTFTSTTEKCSITPSTKSIYLSRLKHHNCKGNTRQQFKLQLLDCDT